SGTCRPAGPTSSIRRSRCGRPALRRCSSGCVLVCRRRRAHAPVWILLPGFPVDATVVSLASRVLILAFRSVRGGFRLCGSISFWLPLSDKTVLQEHQGVVMKQK
ncbi:unnamed protein product, partial [Phaeothamnion confervicola]